MSSAPYRVDEWSPPPDVKQTPFAQVLVTLTKQEYTQLVWDANYWKSAHQRALARVLQLEADHQQAIAQSALREATLRDELNIAQARIRDLQKRVFGRKTEHSSHADKTQTERLKPNPPKLT